MSWFLGYFTAVNIAILVAAVTMITVVYAVRAAGDDSMQPVPVALLCRLCDGPDNASEPCNCTGDCGRRRCRARVGDDTIAMLCLCCNGAKGPDCICTDDCGEPRCQASDPEEAVP